MPFIFLIGLLFYAFSVAKKWKQFNGISVAHFFATRYGRKLELLVAGVLFLAMLGFSATYIKSLTLLILSLIPIPEPLLSAALVALVLVLTVRGGLNSIIALDVLAFIFVVIFFPLLVYFSYHLPQSNQAPVLNLAQMQTLLPPKFIISLIILTMFSYIMAPWYGQKIVAAKTPQTAYFAAAIAAIIIFLLYALGILATAILRSKGVHLADIQLGLPYLIHNALPPSLQGIAYVVLFFVAASTLAGVWNAMVTIIAGSFLKSNSRRINSNIIWVIICAIGAYIIANTLVDNILSKMKIKNKIL